MGLLSLFQRRTDHEAAPVAIHPEQPTPLKTAETLWRCGVFESYPLGEQVQAVHRTGDTPRIFPSFALEFALSCSEFQPLRQHVAEYTERHAWDSLQVQALERLLPELHDAGLLVCTTDLLTRIAADNSQSTPPPIRFIGFPTGGPRVALLERALRSFADNVRQHERTIDYLVADSSAQPEHSSAFRERLAALQSELGISILYAGPDQKRSFVAALAKTGACSAESAEFALLDPLGTGFACGANRNALLLHGAGDMICSVDDDVVCRLAAPPNAESGLACFSNTDPYSRWLFANRERGWEAAQWTNGDFLGSHEELLGRSIGKLFHDVAPDRCEFSQTGGSFIRRIESKRGFVRATFFGHVGDPGIPSSAYYLYYDGENRRRLTESEAHYRSVFGSRSVHTMVPRPAVGDSSVSPGMAMGLDHRTLLPPFIPVLHAEDYAWGAALWQCCGDAFLGHVPLAIQHDPGAGKTILTPGEFTQTRRVVIFEWAHLLRRLILNFEPAEQEEPAARMRSLGEAFIQLANHSKRDFATALAEVVLEHESEKLSWLEKQLSEDTESPEFWREDVQKHLDHIREALTHEDFDIPFDLKERRTPAEARALIQSLIGRYGNLLREWPAMVEAAAELRRRGEGLFAPL
ncbi:hypothetical protein ACXR0O_19575 [Verrucomicrobiota bacterium sgz303538]